MNLFENDTISVKSKKSASEHIIGRYGDFGWTLIKREDDKLYENISHLTFTRPHCVKNKDKLQLLQVRLEIAYNDMGRYSHKISVRTALFGSLFGLLSAGLCAGGVLLFLLIEGLLPIIFGALTCALGIAVGIFCAKFCNRVYKRNKDKYSRLIEEQVKKIDGLCSTARILRGEDEKTH